MDDVPFDAYAEQYDLWFLANRQVLNSETRLLAGALGNSIGRCISAACATAIR